MTPQAAPEDWTLDVVKNLCNEPSAEESATLDFKRSFGGWFAAGDDVRLRTMRDIASFANNRGGTIVYGVAECDERPGVAHELTPIPRDDAVRFMASIKDMAASHLDVRPALECRLIAERDSDTGYVLVTVQPNSRSLTTVRGRDGCQFWIRTGTSNRPMDVHEIRWRFNEIQKVFDEASNLAVNARTDFENRGPPWIWLAATPVGRKMDSLRLSPDDLRAHLDGVARSGSLSEAQRQEVKRFCEVGAHLRPSARGVGVGRNHENSHRAWISVDRSGLVRIGWRLLHVQGEVSASEVYRPWAVGLLLAERIFASTGIAASALLEGGIARCGAVFLREFPTASDVRSLTAPHFAADRVQAEAGWDPLGVLASFAADLASAVECEHPLVGAPWIEGRPSSS